MGIPSRYAYRQINVLRKIAKGANNLLEFKVSNGRNHQRSLDRLEKKGLILLGGEEIKLTRKGIQTLRNIDKFEIRLTVPEKWDGNWHLVAYDVPEKLKYTRNYFRKKLIELEFTKLQGSLWLYPHNCKEEISILAKSLNIENYVMYLNTDFVPNQNKYLKKYNLKK